LSKKSKNDPFCRFSKFFFLNFLALFFFGCGVKSRPLPPEKPSVLGRGERVFSESKERSEMDKKGFRVAP
jgi:hypothetical protein